MSLMSYCGVAGYQPEWLRGATTVEAVHGRRLGQLVGRELRTVWLVWDRASDEWFTDAPVVLEFVDEQLEIHHQKLDELSITWRTVDLSQPIVWPSESFSLIWRAGARQDLDRLAGSAVRSTELLEWAGGDLADGMVAVGVEFDAGYLLVSNGLDENDLAVGPPPDPASWRRHRVGGS